MFTAKGVSWEQCEASYWWNERATSSKASQKYKAAFSAVLCSSFN